MMKIPAMVDMKRTPAEKADDLSPAVNNEPDYPYGLCISLCSDELDKLGLTELPEVGEMLHIHAMATVTAVSQNDSGSGPQRRVELQITHMVGEDEDEENAESDRATPPERRKRLYAAG
jgi:hypothetical protein